MYDVWLTLTLSSLHILEYNTKSSKSAEIHSEITLQKSFILTVAVAAKDIDEGGGRLWKRTAAAKIDDKFDV